ncbi:glycosyltransferase family 2 protein [Brevibacterium oceani]|uniref:glycosyltransferase family 2 protein n=1 Tax=Brevibacterium oceani TaxID=358099 RepID=UPI0015E690EE|nr:glycosyltransferase family 2 protein [Brevibacterium oceani]
MPTSPPHQALPNSADPNSADSHSADTNRADTHSADTNRARIDLILPCLDEAAALPGVLAGLPDGIRAIVVDNGSTDASAEVARAHGAHVVVEPRRGFGSAVHAGVRAATAEVVAICDGDGSFDLGELDRVTGPVLTGRADLVLGRRRAVSPRAWPLHARLANSALAGLIRLRTGIVLGDLGPMRAMRRHDLLALDLSDRRSGYPLEMVLRARTAGLRIREVPVTYRPRVGRSKVTGTLRGTLTAITDMSRLIREETR